MNKALQLAQIVLKESDKPMTVNDIYDYAEKKYPDILKQTFNGATPKATLSACLTTSVKKQDSIFIRFDDFKSALFGLREKIYVKISGDVDAEQTEELKNLRFKEYDLHRFLVSYMSDKYNIHCKTVESGKSSGKKQRHKNTWMHPDIIGVKFLKESYEKETIDLMAIGGEIQYELYSFEIKKSIEMSTANEEFSQAATNSSWANYGYLVAKDIDETGELMDKLRRLNKTFGIGVIKLNVKTYSDSRILFESRKNDLDFDFINALVKLKNNDALTFFKEVTAICKDARPNVYSEKFDEPFRSDVDGAKYAKSKNIILE